MKYTESDLKEGMTVVITSNPNHCPWWIVGSAYWTEKGVSGNLFLTDDEGGIVDIDIVLAILNGRYETKMQLTKRPESSHTEGNIVNLKEARSKACLWGKLVTLAESIEKKEMELNGLKTKLKEVSESLDVELEGF